VLSIDVSMSAGSTELAMSISEVRIIVRGSDGRAHKWHSLLDSLIVVGLRCMHELHSVSKCYLNSDPLSYIK
jgi:hypothetical protein